MNKVPLEYIFKPNLNVAVVATGPETDFTLETDGNYYQKGLFFLLTSLRIGHFIRVTFIY